MAAKKLCYGVIGRPYTRGRINRLVELGQRFVVRLVTRLNQRRPQDASYLLLCDLNDTQIIVRLDG